MYCDYVTSFHTLTPIVDVVYTERLIERLRAALMTLDTSRILSSGKVDAEKLKKNGFCSCNCTVFLKDLWCEHVLFHAMVTKLVKKFPPRYAPKRMGPPTAGRPLNVVRGGALGYQ